MIKCLTIIQIELKFGIVGFLGEGKTGVPGETLLRARERINTKLNPHTTPGPGIEPGTPWWKASALTTGPSLLLQSQSQSKFSTCIHKLLYLPSDFIGAYAANISEHLTMRDRPPHRELRLSTFFASHRINYEELCDWAYVLLSLSEETRKSNHLQMSLQRQHFLLNYLKTLSVGPAGV